MTDWIPADLSCSMTSGASLDVRACSVNWAGMVDHHRSRQACLLEVRQQVVVDRKLVARTVARDDRDLLGGAEQTGRLTPGDESCEDLRLVGSCPPQIRRAFLRVLVDTVVHCPINGVWPSWVMHSSLSPFQVPMPSSTAKTGGLPSVHCLQSERISCLAGRVEIDDVGNDLAAVDATGGIDRVDVRVDRKRLLGVLDVTGESESAGKVRQVGDREDDADRSWR